MTIYEIKQLKEFLEKNSVRVSGFRALEVVVNQIRASISESSSKYPRCLCLEFQCFPFTVICSTDFDVKQNKPMPVLEYAAGHITSKPVETIKIIEAKYKDSKWYDESAGEYFSRTTPTPSKLKFKQEYPTMPDTK